MCRLVSYEVFVVKPQSRAVLSIFLLLNRCICKRTIIHYPNAKVSHDCEITPQAEKRTKTLAWASRCIICSIHVISYGFFESLFDLKDVRAHCYCASLVCTLYMTWRVPRHVFQARVPSRNSTKYRAGDLCGNLICEYFCWMLRDPHFFFGRSLPFLILSIILKNEKICTWEVLIISHILFKLGRIGTWIQMCAI